MNCKPGDIARIVGGYIPENINKLVRVIGRADRDEEIFYFDGEPSWKTESLQHMLSCSSLGVYTMRNPGSIGVCADYGLRPLYDGDGQDESLTWKKKETCLNQS